MLITYKKHLTYWTKENTYFDQYIIQHFSFIQYYDVEHIRQCHAQNVAFKNKIIMSCSDRQSLYSIIDNKMMCFMIDRCHMQHKPLYLYNWMLYLVARKRKCVMYNLVFCSRTCVPQFYFVIQIYEIIDEKWRIMFSSWGENMISA